MATNRTTESASLDVLGRCAWLLIAIVLSGCGNPESRSERLLREAALKYPRPTEARLSTSVRFARWTGSTAVQRPDLLPLSDDKNKRVLRGSRPVLDQQEPEELHRTGLLWLYNGDAARAVAALETVAEGEASATVLSDLAAAYLALSEEDQPWLRVDALAAATRAVELAPNESYAAFNRALALERMSLAHEAGLAWDRYIEFEEDPDWRKEASERLVRLRQPTNSDSWEVERNRVAR